MKIKLKLLLSFLSVIVLTVILGLVSYFTISSLSNNLIPAITANGKIHSGMLDLRKNEKDFLIRSTKDAAFFKKDKSKYLTNFESTYANLEKEIIVLKAFSDETKFQTDVKELNELLSSYKLKFFNVVKAKKERGFEDSGLIGKLRESIHAIEDELGKLRNEDLIVISMLQIRRHEKDYLLRDDLNELKEIIKEVANFKRLVNSSSLATEDKSNFSTLIQNYQDKFNAVVALDKKIGRTANRGLTGDYRDTIHKLEPLLEKIEIEFKSEVKSSVTKGMIIILITLALVVLISLILVFYLTSIISTPLKQMADASRKVAGGDLEATLPKVNTNDEVKDLHVVLTSLIGALKYHMRK